VSLAAIALCSFAILVSILLALNLQRNVTERRCRFLMARSLVRSLRRETKLKARVRDLEAAQEHLLEERGHFLVELNSLLCEVMRAGPIHPCSDHGEHNV
jgi:hypothetical protein